MSTKTRQTTPQVPTQRGKVERDASTAPPAAPPEHADHRVRNITLVVTTAVIALGAVLVLWFAVFSGDDSPAPTSPNNISQGTDNSHDFLRQQQERPVGPEDGSDQRLHNQAPDESQSSDIQQRRSDPF